MPWKSKRFAPSLYTPSPPSSHACFVSFPDLNRNGSFPQLQSLKKNKSVVKPVVSSWTIWSSPICYTYSWTMSFWYHDTCLVDDGELQDGGRHTQPERRPWEASSLHQAVGRRWPSLECVVQGKINAQVVRLLGLEVLVRVGYDAMLYLRFGSPNHFPVREEILSFRGY